MLKVTLENLSKDFGSHRAVNNVDFKINEGEFFTLLGPSGCGKTTLLRTIAGFYKQDEGNIYFGEKLINDIPTHQRNIGMVFQNYAIFPHMSVFDNVAYGLVARKIDKKEIERRVMEALDIVELAHLRNRIPSDLSGGQQQRIALARAIVIRPGLLLMDEPLSNLDAKLRVKMRNDIKRLQRDLNITTIYVTHDQEEALAVSDRIAVLKDGVVQQIDTPQNIYLMPHNQFVANFMGTSNFIKGHCELEQNGETIIYLLDKSIRIPSNIKYEGEIMVSIRPEDINLSLDQADNNLFRGEIELSVFLGEKVSYLVRLTNGDLIEVYDHPKGQKKMLEEKQIVYLDLGIERTVILNATGDEVIYRGNKDRESILNQA
ncbi:ABC transporter ATP-binding protein [Bacillus sp. FJAT-50079]|uniref:ABC transporter ATP-binding protein n=1 Tax=Bacillus sp. FJAT-50079 TaxID=2833577 RepID=UPI001BCA3F8F|nr:ABC transporter ATP-binding protein [Bacillus sp. FJAT-50079]MBS4208093.1 ABC transporter ATP-binding protein [Bacillus sp. FJAT-50079]